MELSNYWGITSLHGKVQYDIIPQIDPQTVTESESRSTVIAWNSELTMLQSKNELQMHKPMMLSKNVRNTGKIIAPSLNKYVAMKTIRWSFSFPMKFLRST